MQLVQSRNISSELVPHLRELIITGEIKAGRINEVHLAAALGVSRTPLREALIRLQAEGAVVTIPRQGFFVQPLSEREFDEIYPLRAELDPLALRLSGIPSREVLARLRSLNAKLAKCRDAEKAVGIDDDWHRTLLSEANATLNAFIEQLIWRTRRYELALMKGPANVERAVAEHDAVIDALEQGKLEIACEALAANLRSGKAPIVKRLRNRNSNS